MPNNDQRIEPPAIPLARPTYAPSDQDYTNNVLRLFFNRLTSIINNIANGLTDSSGIGDGSNMVLSDLPTSDPGVAGQVWNDAGTLKVSSGP